MTALRADLFHWIPAFAGMTGFEYLQTLFIKALLHYVLCAFGTIFDPILPSLWEGGCPPTSRGDDDFLPLDYPVMPGLTRHPVNLVSAFGALQFD